MHFPAHLAASWLCNYKDSARRSRLLVAWAGVAPDVDALSMLAGQDAYATYHHVLCHGLAFGLCVAAVVFAATRSVRVSALAFAAFHLHLALDLLGSGRQWPIRYFFPVSDVEVGFPYGWELASWQNTLFMVALIVVAVRLAPRVQRTFAESVLPPSVDALVASTLARWLRR